MKKEIQNCLTWLINRISETIIYNWGDDFKAKENEKSFETFYEELKKYIDFTKLTVEEAKTLRFQKWSEEYPNLWLFPLYLVPIIPEGLKIIGIDGDAGLTGRKIVVDQYQSFANVGGGAFSGKDPTKVDRSGAYKARELAKNILQKENFKWCEVQLSYAIGMESPLAIYIDTDKGGLEPPAAMYEECKLKNIIKDLDLKNKCYEETARFGHFQ